MSFSLLSRSLNVFLAAPANKDSEIFIQSERPVTGFARYNAAILRNSLITASTFCVLTFGLTAHALELVSAGPSGAAGNYSSWVDPALGFSDQAISEDGRYVVFQSTADDLVANDDNGVPDIYLRDRQAQTTELISVDSNEVLSIHTGCGLEIFECGSRQASVSNDGRYVAFLSDATNLVANDTNGGTDAFVRDRLSGETIRISVDPAGQEIPAFFGNTQGVVIAGDGGFALISGFFSDGITSGQFIRYDLVNRTAEFLSIPTVSFGVATSISDDGNRVAFWDLADPTATEQIYRVWVWDIDQESIERVDVDSNEVPANAVPALLSAPTPLISGNGQFVAFASTADNLVANDTNTNANDTCAPGNDVFLRDLVNGTTERVSINSAGEQAELPEICSFHQAPKSISTDGSRIVFQSDALNFDPLSPEAATFDDVLFYVYSTVTNELTKLYSSQTLQYLGDPQMSGDGNHFVFPFSESAQDFLQLPLNSTDIIISVYHASLAELTAPDTDGDELADQDETATFFTDPTKMDTDDDGLSDAGEIAIGSNPAVADGDSDGVNDISDVSPNNGSVSTSATMELISVGETGSAGSDYVDFANSSSVYSSGDGRFVVFDSLADDLVSIDSNRSRDVFLRDRQTQATELVSQSTAGVVADLPNDSVIRLSGSTPHGVSDDGRYVVFSSSATNLVDGDVNELKDLFLRDRQAGTTLRIYETASDLGSDFAFSRNGTFLYFSDDGQAYRYDVQSQLVSPFAINALPGATVLSASSDGQILLVQNASLGLSHYDSTGDVATQILAPSTGGPAWYEAMISGNGRYVAFNSEADSIVSGDSNLNFPECLGDGADVFIWDSTDGAFELVTVSSSGEQAQYAPFCGPDFENYPVAVSDDGSLIAFNSRATNLDPTLDVFDGNSGFTFTYVRNRTDGTTTLVSNEYQDTKRTVFALGMSGDGSSLFITEFEWPFNPADNNTLPDLYALDLTTFTNNAPDSPDNDYNGDGQTDILWRNSVTGQNWLYLMNGSTIETSEGINTVPTDWAIAGNGDYNGDGQTDILWRNSVTGQNWLYLMNGATIETSQGINKVSTDWAIVGNGDYNGDGKSDILWRNSVTGQNWLYLMNGATIEASEGISKVPADWVIVGSGDYNGDGKSDILWRNSVTGQNGLYLMNGSTIEASEVINTVPTSWQLINAP